MGRKRTQADKQDERSGLAEKNGDKFMRKKIKKTHLFFSFLKGAESVKTKLDLYTVASSAAFEHCLMSSLGSLSV